RRSSTRKKPTNPVSTLASTTCNQTRGRLFRVALSLAIRVASSLVPDCNIDSGGELSIAPDHWPWWRCLLGQNERDPRLAPVCAPQDMKPSLLMPAEVTLKGVT